MKKKSGKKSKKSSFEIYNEILLDRPVKGLLKTGFGRDSSKLLHLTDENYLKTWEHCSGQTKIYYERCIGKLPEMDCARQLVKILKPISKPGMSLLDAGCGPGHFYKSLKKLKLEYYGIDSTPHYIEMGKRLLYQGGLHPDRLQVKRIEGITTQYDIVVCFNTLPFLPNYHLPIERLCLATKKFLIIRMFLGEKNIYRYVPDKLCDEGYKHLRDYFNIYSSKEVKKFIEGMNFNVKSLPDARSKGNPEIINGLEYPWGILFCEKKK